MAPVRTAARVLLVALICLDVSASVGLSGDESDLVRVGAIRWDAFYGPRDSVGVQVQKCMDPPEYHWRVPFCGRVLPNNSVLLDCGTPAAMEEELRVANRAGLNYFAFDMYPLEGTGLSLSLTNYLSSSSRGNVSYCMLMANVPAPSDSQSTKAYLTRFAAYFKDAHYERVGERPLVYFFQQNCSDNSPAAVFAPKLRQAAALNNISAPYFVWLTTGQAERGAQCAKALNLDAVSAYALPEGATPEGAPFSTLANNARQFWAACAATGAATLPIVPTDWDPRPYHDHCPIWTCPSANHFLAPTGSELAGLVRDAMTWARQGKGPTKVLMDAWNENAEEGPCLIPTLGNGTAYLDALRPVLRP